MRRPVLMYGALLSWLYTYQEWGYTLCYLTVLHIQYAFLTIQSTELIANPKAHSTDWQSIVLYVNIGLFPPCSIICNEAILFLNNIRKLIHACFFFKSWKSTVGENQRQILKGTRTDFLSCFYILQSPRGVTLKSLFFSFFLLSPSPQNSEHPGLYIVPIGSCQSFVACSCTKFYVLLEIRLHY